MIGTIFARYRFGNFIGSHGTEKCIRDVITNSFVGDICVTFVCYALIVQCLMAVEHFVDLLIIIQKVVKLKIFALIIFVLWESIYHHFNV